MAVVGMGGHVFDLVRVDRPRQRFGVDDIVADLAELADGAAATWRTDALVGIGWRSSASSAATTGSCRRRRTSAGATSRWARCSPSALCPPAPIVVANEADLGALAEHRRGAAAGADDVIFLSGEVGLGGGLIVGGRPLTGVAGYGGEVGHMPVNPLAGATCRCGSVGCWETEVGEEALLVRAGRPRDGGGRRRRGDPRRRRRRRRRRRSPRSTAIGPVARDRPRRPRQHAQPGARRARRAARAAPSVRRGDGRGRARPARPRRAARSSRSSRRGSASTPRCSAPPSWRSSRSSPIRPTGCRPSGVITPRSATTLNDNRGCN